MDNNKITNQAVLSKTVVAVLIIIILLGVAVFIWWSYQPVATSDNTALDSSTTTGSEVSTTDSQSATSVPSNEIDTEVKALDQAIATVNDDALSDSAISNSNLGL